MTAGKRRRGKTSQRRPRGERIALAEACRLLGLEKSQLYNLAASHRDFPVVIVGRERFYLWPQLREWRDKQLLQQGVASVRPQSVEEARARKLAAEADLKELELGERRGWLMPAAMFRQEFEAACTRIRAHQLNAPARYAPQLLEAFTDRLGDEHLPGAEQFIRQMMQEQMAELEAGDDIPDVDDESPYATVQP